MFLVLKSRIMINSLYIHIPFCMKKCIYCDFFSVPYDDALALRYAGALMHELEIRKELVNELKTVYIGGGTPTTIPSPSLIGLLRKIRDTFSVSPEAEITVEANPGTIDKEKACALANAGVSRFSIGVQSFNNNELKLLGRIHTSEHVIKAVGALRYAGVRNLSIDLIYGIPGQTIEAWSHTLRMAMELSPEHISAYELTPEKGTPFYEAIARKELEKPPEESILDMYYHAIDGLEAAGCRHYEISNFAKPGFECRHNLNYWNRGEYIGIGAAAHSFIGDRRVKNVSDVGRYVEALQKGDLAVEESVEISCEEAIRETIFLGLRKTEGLNIRELREELGIDIVEAASELIDQALLEVEGERLRLTRKGIVVSNSVITELFQQLAL
jgi:oxygen-independent coproporphyrinogen-3 oxidase